MADGAIEKAKEVLPPSLVNFGKAVLNGFPSLVSASLRQAVRFERSYSRDGSGDVLQLESHIVYCTHQVEKGLSHQDFRSGFGARVLSELAGHLARFEKIGGDTSGIAYQSAIAALSEYRERHAADAGALDAFRGRIGDDLYAKLGRGMNVPGGSLAFDHTCGRDNGAASLPYEQLLCQRHSVREYSNEPVDVDKVRSAIDLAMRAPSACNRQPTRLRLVLDEGMIESILGITSGFRGYKMPPALIVVTVDNRVYFGPQEHNEGFVDGGIFSMALLLALEDKGLASCPLNTMLRRGPEKRLRELVGLPHWEEFVMLIAVGNYPENPLTCQSARLGTSDILTVVE